MGAKLREGIIAFLLLHFFYYSGNACSELRQPQFFFLLRRPHCGSLSFFFFFLLRLLHCGNFSLNTSCGTATPLNTSCGTAAELLRLELRHRRLLRCRSRVVAIRNLRWSPQLKCFYTVPKANFFKIFCKLFSKSQNKLFILVFPRSTCHL